MKTRAKKLAGTLVLSGFTQTIPVNAEEISDAQTEEVSNPAMQEEEKKEAEDAVGESDKAAAKEEEQNAETDASKKEVKETKKKVTAVSEADNKEAKLEGEGTTESPYLVKTVEDLKFVAEKINAGEAGYAKAVYKQTTNINLNGSKGNQWTPIGTTDNKFTGTFIGTDYEIQGLYIDNAELENAGLFGHIASPAKLEGITINGAKVNGKSNVGAIAGAAYTGSATKCTVKGKIEISGNYKVGGMFGGGYISITDSSVTAETGSTVTGIHKTNNLEGDNVGGLIGFRGEGNIKTERCSVSGVTVAGTRKVGGLIGSAFADNITSGCSVRGVSLVCNAPYDYAKGSLVKNQLCVGGLVGIYHKSGSNGGSLSNCTVEDVNFSVSVDAVKEENWAIMGIVSGGYRASSYSGASAPDGQIKVEGLTVSGTNTGSTAEEKFPGSVAMNGEQKLFANGTGTAEDPFIISSVDDLKVFANSVTKTGITYDGQYVKVADGMEFDLSDGLQIGSSSKKFMGTFDGNGVVLNNLIKAFFNGTGGATVKNITVNAPTKALFAFVDDTVIENIKLNNVKFEKASGTGALINGSVSGTTTIDGVEVTGSISGTDYVGGIMGGRATMKDGDVITIKNCVNRATITGTGKVGGIIGYTNSSKGRWVIENCKNYGDITSEIWAGGISGGTTRVAVSSCVNEGKIQGAEVTGGIVATANSGTTVTGCSNKGDVVDTKGCAGGIIGSSSSGGNIVSQSANTGNITGVTSAGGIIGGTAAAGDAIDNCYNGGDIKATGDKAIAAGIYGYNNSTSPIKACINDGKVTAEKGTVYQIGLSNYWYDQATGSKIATCYYIDEDGKIYAAAEDGKGEPVEQKDMSRSELAEILNTAGEVENFWQAQNDSVQPDPIIPGAFDDKEKRVALILDKDGNEIEGYTSLAEAANAVEDGQTIVLEKDVVLEEKLVFNGNKEVTLDLKGNTLTLKDGVKAPVLEVGNNATGNDNTKLILTDSATKKGVVKSTANSAAICVRTGASMITKNVNISFEDKDHSAYNMAIQVQGTLTVEKGTKLDSTEYGIGAITNSKVIVNGGEITAKEAAVSGNGTWHDTEIVINGGELTSTGSSGIYHPQRGTLTLNGGTIKGLTGVQMCAGELNIPKDSTVKVIATGKDGRGDKGAGDGPINDGAAISIVNRDYPGGVPTASIKGGSFVAEQTDNAVLAYTWNAKAEGDKHSEWTEAGDKVAVSGGTYNTPIAEELLADGFGMNEPDKNGNYGVHEHKMTKFEKKDATCTEAGAKQAYFKCSVCEKYFEDEDGKIEITNVEDLIIPAKGHLDENKDDKCDICGVSLSDKPNPDTNTGKDPNGSSDNGNGSNDKGKTDKGAVKTGDTANVAGYLSIMVLARRCGARNQQKAQNKIRNFINRRRSMKVRAKKLAALMLAGMLVLSGLGQTGVVNAEETTEQTESTLTQGDKKEEQTNSLGEKQEETEGKEEKSEASGIENSTSDTEDGEEKTVQNQSVVSANPNDMQAKQAPAEGAVVSLTQGDSAIGDYKTIAEALKNVKDYNYSTNKAEYVITLQKDISEDVVIPAKKKIAIDLNGHKLTNVDSHTIYNNSTNIRVIDQKGGGVVDNITHGKAAVYNNIKSNITLSGGTFTRSKEASMGDSASGGNSFYVLKNFGTMTINDGVNVKFSDENRGLFSSLVGNGWQDAIAAEAGKNGEPKPSEGSKKATLNIKGGNLYGGQITVKNDDYGNLTVSGGTIVQPSEGRAAIANNHIATITGGQIEAQGKNGQAVYSRHFDTDGANNGELTISGGTFKSTGTVIQAQKGSKLDVTAGTFATSGKDSYIFEVQDNVTSSIKNGTYEGVTADKVANKEGAFAEGYAPQTDKNGNITVDVKDESASAVIISKDGTEKKYVKAQEAGKALNDGETLKLLKDYVSTPDYDWGISISAADVTVDLNGHSVTSNKETDNSSNGYAIKFAKPTSGAKNHTVTIKNSGDKQSVLKSSMYQIYAQSGNSRYNVIVKLEGDIVLKDTNDSEEALGIMLGTGAKLLDTETAHKVVPNGGFSVKEADGNNYIYGDYANAIDKSVDKYVLMLNDYTTNSSISSGSKSGTLDLGGNTYTYTSEQGAIVNVNYPNVELKITNGVLEATGESVDGAHLIGDKTQMNNRSLILDKVELTVPGEVYGIVTNGTETGNKVVLKDSVLNVKEGYGIYFPSTGSVTIDNSVINAKYTGVQMCAGDLTVTGDKTAIYVTGEPQEKTDGDGPIADGAAISIIEREGYKDLGKVTIENGTFKAAEGVEAIKAYKFDNANKVQEWEEAGDVVDVTGGKFSTVIPENICGDKFIL